MVFKYVAGLMWLSIRSDCVEKLISLRPYLKTRNFLIILVNVIFVRRNLFSWSQRKVESREWEWPLHLLQCFVANGLSLEGGQSLMRHSTALFTDCSSNIRSWRREGVKALLRHRGSDLHVPVGSFRQQLNIPRTQEGKEIFAIFLTLGAWDDTTMFLLPPYRSLACFQLHSRREHLSL